MPEVPLWQWEVQSRGRKAVLPLTLQFTEPPLLVAPPTMATIPPPKRSLQGHWRVSKDQCRGGLHIGLSKKMQCSPEHTTARMAKTELWGLGCSEPHS